MNNIQKNFKGKAKRGLCMATGGILDPERDQLRFDQAQSMKQDALTAGNAQIGEIAGARGLSNRQRSRAIGEVRGVMSSFGAVGDQPTLRGLSARQQNNDGIANFTSGLRAQSANNTLAAADPALTAVAPTSAPTVQPDDRGWKRVDIANGGMFMADGGIVGPDGLTDAQRAKLSGARTNLGVSNAAPAPAPAAPTPAPAAPAPAQQAPSIGGAVNSIRERQRVLSNLATGGVVGAKTFEFEGKGTGTSDDIPVKVAGNSINVSDGEKAVILPAKTAQNPQALDMIETVIQQSNGGRAPNRGLRNGGQYVNGVVPGPMPLLDDEVRARSAANLAARGRAPGPTVTPTPGGAVMKPMIAPMEMPTIPATATAEQPGGLRRGLNWVAGKAGFAPAAGATGAAPAAATPATAPAAQPRPASIAQYTPQMVKEAIKERIPQALQTVKGAGTGLLKNLNTVANTTVAAGDLAAAGHANEDGGWGQVRDTAMAIPRVMAGAAGADVDLGKVRNGIRGLEAAGNAVTGFVADRLPTGWVTGLMGGAANSATGFRPMTRGIQALNGESPIQEMYRTEFNTSKDQMPGVFETARNGVAAMSSDGQTTVMRNKNNTPEGADTAQPPDAQAQPASLPAQTQAYPMSVPGGPAAPEAATVAPGTRTIRTANGDVTATRDKRGQLVVTSGNADDPDAETKRATEATRMRADMARQVDNFEKMRIDSDLSSNSTGDRQRGALRQSVRTANQQAEIEKAKAANEASWKQSDLDIRKEDVSLKREAAQREMEQKRFENEDKANEGAIKRDEALTKRLASRFVTKDAKGNQTPNTEAAADFLSHADATVAEMEKKTRGTPEHSRWFNRNTGKPKGAGDLGTTDLDMLTGLYDVKRRFRDSAGSLPGYADKGDSLDLMDYAGTINGEHVEFPRLSAKQKRSVRAQKKDFDFEDGPIGAMDFTTSHTGTPTDRYTRHFTQGK